MTNDKYTNYLWSWGYWFSSRSQGLLVHPYVTMREIVRQHFLRPLTVLPVVIWIISWMVALVMGRLGLWLGLNEMTWTVWVGRVLVFSWVWLTVFLSMWQMVLSYLYVRFTRINVFFR